jgi:hypothetical protein
VKSRAAPGCNPRAPSFGWRHVKRRAAYVALLLTADVALLGVFTLLIEIMRIGPWFAPAVGEALDTLLPNATVPSLGFPLAVVFSLAMLGAYGALDPREAIVRRLVAAGLAVTLPAWPALWK